MIVAGAGLSARCAARELADLVLGTAASLGIAMGEVAALAVPEAKAAHPAARGAAGLLGLPLKAVSADDMGAAACLALTDSPRARAALGVPSAAETAALAAAGADSRLLAPRAASPRATCAFATKGGATKGEGA